MKKNNELKKDIFAIFIYILTFSVIYLILTTDNHLFASIVDFRTQHYLIPEYFRNQFYNTHDLLPDFTGDSEGAARSYANAHGINVTFKGTGGYVVAQSYPANKRIDLISGSVVLTLSGSSYKEPSYTPPTDNDNEEEEEIDDTGDNTVDTTQPGNSSDGNTDESQQGGSAGGSSGSEGSGGNGGTDGDITETIPGVPNSSTET